MRLLLSVRLLMEDRKCKRVILNLTYIKDRKHSLDDAAVPSEVFHVCG
jgi:hypothetical protein